MHLDLMHICKIFIKINRYLCFSFQTFLFMQIDYQIHLRSFNMVTIENNILILSVLYMFVCAMRTVHKNYTGIFYQRSELTVPSV